MILPFARYLTLVAVTLALAGPVVAQNLPTVLPGTQVMADILNKRRVISEINPKHGDAVQSDQQFVPQWTPSPAPSESGSRARSTISAITSSSYYAEPAVTARVRVQFGEWLARGGGTADDARLAEAIFQHDPLSDWAQIVEGDGLRPDDIVDVLASYWILNWVMANGVDSNQAGTQAVRAQMRRMLNPAYVRLNGDQRQELAEALILNFLMQHAAYTDAVKRGDQAITRQLGEAAEARFRKELGVDLRRLKLTSAGFVLAG